MEGNATELLDGDLRKGGNLSEDVLVNEKLNELKSENQISRKSVEELKKDEEMLNSYLNNLKKENFKLETTVNAWKTTLRNKLEEFKEADLKLDEILCEIQSEREDFCSKLDKFNDEYGVLSAWWEKQMNFLSQLENLEEKNSQEMKCKEEITKLEEDIELIKKQIELLAQAEKQVTEVEVHMTQEGEPFVRSYEVSPGRVNAKKIKALEEEEEEEEDEIICEGKSEMSETLYSLVDVEKVRMVSRRRNRRRAFFNKIKKLIKQ